MYLPKLHPVRVSRETTDVFRGYNRTETIRPDEFYDMRNMTSSKYPALANRPRRGMVRRLAKPNGLFVRDRLCWADGTDFYYDGVVRGQVEDSEKQFVSMGAYILIWPDKAYYNTESGEFGGLEARRTTSGTVTYTLCRADGSAYEAYRTADTPPESPADGHLWVDTSQAPHVLKQYSAQRMMWVSMPTVFVKIEGRGIGAGFAEYDGVTITGCEIEGIGGDMLLYGVGDDFLIVAGIIDETGSQETALTIARTVPDMDYLTECGNRVWGCSSAAHEVYACALGDPKNWRRYMGNSTDSYAVTIGSAGPFTGACTHMGYVMFFKENVIHKLYGHKPSNFQLSDTVARGVRAGAWRSLEVVSETLYYMAEGGVCAYGASLPMGIGEALGLNRQGPQAHFEQPQPHEAQPQGGHAGGTAVPAREGRTGRAGQAAAGGLMDKYYISTQNSAGEWNLYVYDALRGLWHREDETRALAFARMDGTLYCLRADGWLFTTDGTLGPYASEDAHREGEKRHWLVETGDIGSGIPDRKYISKIQLRLEVGENAMARISVRYDHREAWQEMYRINPGVKKAYTVPMIPRRCDTVRIRLEGYGDVTIYSLTKTIEGGSER